MVKSMSWSNNSRCNHQEEEKSEKIGEKPMN
jgi:hypothetical protein